MPRRARFLLVLVTLAVLATALTPIRSWDYFWHLSTGEWILRNGGLPATDPFSIGSDDRPWIDGAWLFQAGLAVLHRAGSHALVSVSRAIITALLFALVFLITARRCDEWIALLMSALASWGAWARLDARPETAGIVCATLAVLLLQRGSRWSVVYYALLTAIWINLHPSALLAVAIAGLALIGAMVRRAPGEIRRLATICIAAMLALLVNPWGVRGITAPLSLASQTGSGGFVNLEWLPSDPRIFPLLYVALVAGAAVVVRDRGRHPFEALLFVFLSVLAVRWVRNQGFFFVIMPLALSPMLASLRLKEDHRRLASIVAIAALALSLSPALSQPPGLGPDIDRFPTRSARMIEELNLQGHIFNADQFGGFLIWTVFPERRVLIDGRNELYTELIPRLLRARGDSREWISLLDEYDIRIAVEEHAHEPLEVHNPSDGSRSLASPSLAYFPRRQWALIGVDPASMLFVRRDSVDARILERYEYTTWRPDIVDPREINDRARWEMERARGERELRRGIPVS